MDRVSIRTRYAIKHKCVLKQGLGAPRKHQYTILLATAVFSSETSRNFFMSSKCINAAVASYGGGGKNSSVAFAIAWEAAFSALLALNEVLVDPCIVMPQ